MKTGNISRSGKERKIKGIHDEMTAGRRKLSINETSVYSTFALISNVAQCIFYDYTICKTGHIYNRRAYTLANLLTDINSFLNNLPLSVSSDP